MKRQWIHWFMVLTTLWIPFGGRSDGERSAILARIAEVPRLEQRVYLIFQQFLETPYDDNGPLGECGEHEDCSRYRDPQPRYGLTETHKGIGEDCVTLRDKVLALSVATAPELTPLRQSRRLSILDLAKYLMDDLRYQPERPISFATRNHYELKDFLRQHEGIYVEDITETLGVATRTIRGTFRPYERFGIDRPDDIILTTYIPRDAIPRILDKLPHSAMIYSIKRLALGPTDANGDPEQGHLLVRHVGLAFHANGHVYFGHASRKQHKVVLEDFTTYFRRQTRLAGIRVLRLTMPETAHIRQLLQ